MNFQLGLRTLLLLAVVAVCTAVLVAPELLGGSGTATARAIKSMLVVGHH